MTFLKKTKKIIIINKIIKIILVKIPFKNKFLMKTKIV